MFSVDSMETSQSKAEEPAPGLDFATARSAFARQELFEDKTWLSSPEAYPLTGAQMEAIEAIGQACLDFFRALETLYLRAAEGRNLLRNRTLKAPWVAEYLDRGKPPALVKYARSKALRGALPGVIRPDLLITENGFALTEIDSVPGGIGLTAFLNRLYEPVHGDALVGAGEDDMVEAFYEVLCACAPTVAAPYIALVVSDEAATYRPEMEWIARELRRRGRRVRVFHPDAVMPLGEAICVEIDGAPQEVDVIYRFWELFDTGNISFAEALLESASAAALRLTPPMRPFQEEKLNLALLHHHILEDFWRENLPRESYRILKRVVPMTWVMDPVELPPNAVLDAPPVGGKPIYDWAQLAEAGKKERSLIIKISGFHDTAWGARSVTLGSDSSKSEWEDAIQRAVTMAETSPHILQSYEKPRRLIHSVYGVDGELRQMEGRMRLCPYYFVDESGQRVRLRGVLATFCPADKKIIHGMKDAALMPCVRVP